ncbi:MAG: NAD-dependent epimerase/dehydratase family protein [Calditrichaeota bacterium]|nr:NAD-dependent epimerase/dehydratase family protein [Calditrichota bacterium]
MSENSENNSTAPQSEGMDIKGKRILLTGATGFVGTHTVHHLVEQGYQVRCLVRKSSDTSRLPAEVEIVEGHLLNFVSLLEATRNCWGVMHVAGVVRVKQMRDFFRINSDGTANLVKAARERNIERFMLCSSLAASGPSKPGYRRKWDDKPEPVTNYGKSKLAGEKTLVDNAGDMWFTIVRPPAVYGPWDAAFLMLVRWVKYSWKLRLGDGSMPFSIIHGSDLARAMTLAFEADQPSGKIWYATDGADHDLQELLSIIEEVMLKQARWLSIPVVLAPLIAHLIEIFAKVRGGSALLSRDKLIELTQPAWTCDDQPLRDVTGYQESYSLAEGMRQTIEWYMEQGRV